MARRRLHSLDDLLDVAEQLVIGRDPAGLTLRSLAASSGASNGTIYHAFRSKDELLARVWLRATERLGTAIAAAVDGVRRDEAAVVAASIAPVAFTRQHRASAHLFFEQRSDQLFSADLPPEVVADLDAQHRRLTTLLIDLATAVWDRKDAVAVDTVATCIVDIPGGIIRRALLEDRAISAATERRIEAAVNAILALPLDPPPTRSSQ